MLGVGWAAGIAIGDVAVVPVALLVLAATASLAAGLLSRSVGVRLLALVLMALLLGQARLGLDRLTHASDPLAEHVGAVSLRGRIVDAPQPRGGRVEAVVEVDAVRDVQAQAEWSTLLEPRPRVLLQAQTIRAVYGDRIETQGRLARPRSRPGWPLAEMLARRGIGWVVDAGGVRVVETGGTSLTSVLTSIRGLFEANTRAALPEPHASLVAGIVFGSRVGLPTDLKTAMSATGTSHLTAVSGQNVALVAGALILLAGRVLGRAPAGVVAIAGVWLYTLLVGAPPSATRAAAMATFALLAYGLGRRPDAILGLVAAAAVLLGWDPGLASDLGFQLSVAATAGLILLSPPIESRLGWLPSALRGQVAVAIAAQIATLPILIGTFQRISLVSLPTNVLAAPLVVPIMSLGVALAVAGSLPGFDVLLGWAAWAVTSLMLAIIATGAGLPGAVMSVGHAPTWLPLAWYGALGCWIAARSADVSALGLRPPVLQGLALALGLVPVLVLGAGWAGASRAEGVELALLDVEPAAAFIRTPAGRTALVTTGSDDFGLAASVGAQLDLWEQTVDVVIGPGGLHAGVELGALDQARGVDHGSAASEPEDLSHDDSETMSAAMRLEPGARIELGDGVRVEVVDVRQAGEQAVVDLVIRVDDVAVLLPGPGTPSARWADVAPDAVTIGRLPVAAVAWARTIPPRRWQLLIGEPSLERARGDSGVPFLTRRDHGLVEVTFGRDGLAVRTERCAGGQECSVDLPVPTWTALIPDRAWTTAPTSGRSDESPEPPVQSGRTGAGR